MCAGQPIQFRRLVASGTGEKSCSRTEFSCIFIAAGSVMPLGLTGLHQCMKVEFVSISFAMNLGHYVLIIVISVKN